MVKVEKSIINLWFSSREQTIDNLSEEDKKRIFEITKGKDTYKEIENLVKELPSECDKEKILNAIEEHSNKLLNISGYENEKFYKAGFKDGINIILESIGGI